MTAPRSAGPRRRRAIAAVALALLLGGCAARGVPAAGRMRFVNRPPVWRVNDRLDVPQKPAKQVFVHMEHMIQAYASRRLPRTLALAGDRPARGINALGEVPDSTWFQNRIGRHALSPDAVSLGPNHPENPENHRPWTVKSTKIGGAQIGFIVEDRRGVKYLLKFDLKHVPEMETAAHTIVHRVLWACGYNVPEDYIVYFRPTDLVLDSEAMIKSSHGKPRRMRRADLDAALAQVYAGADGRIRGLLSRFVPGVPIGGYDHEGTRADDPNDLIPHEQRRDVRGQSVLFSWLQHTDVRPDNTLDAWQPDPADPSRHYVVHYLIDFGKALGVMGHLERRREVGYAHYTDIKYTLLTLPTFGLWTRPWEDRRRPPLRGVGLIDWQSYSPGSFATNLPYFPFYDADRFDAFWAAKIMMRLTPRHLQAIVEAARLTDPRSAEYLYQVLLRRQRRAGRYWFERVSPLDRFVLRATEGSHALCFDDLMVRYALSEDTPSARYAARAYDYNGRPMEWVAETGPTRRGRACLAGLVLAGPHHGYTIVRIVPRRGGRPLAPLEVHLARDPRSGVPRVIGLRRY